MPYDHHPRAKDGNDQLPALTVWPRALDVQERRSWQPHGRQGPPSSPPTLGRFWPTIRMIRCASSSVRSWVELQQLDRAIVVKRMRDGRKREEASGRRAEGAYPYGYTGNGTGKARDKAPNPDEQKAVARIVELHLESLFVSNDRGNVLIPKAYALGAADRWSAMSVRNIAKRTLTLTDGGKRE